MDPREQFQQLLDEYARELPIDSMQTAFENELLALHRARFTSLSPRKAERQKAAKLEEAAALTQKYERAAAISKLVRKSLQVEFDQIYDRHKVDCEAQYKLHCDRRKEIVNKLDALAETLHPEVGTTWLHVETVYVGQYSTQGYGAAHYACGDAEHRAAEIRLQGIAAEVRIVDEPSIVSPTTTHRQYEVHVLCNRLDYEIAKRRPGMTLAQELQWCWNRGINPRVLNPFLPHGLEEKLGVSYSQVRDAQNNLCP